MTRLPFESWNIVARPDLPAYELNSACPVTGEVSGLENHHIVRRSFGPDFGEAWWVELPDGTVVGNRIALSQSAHYRLTVNKARIVYEDGVFLWEEAGESAPLRWQPPIHMESVEKVDDSIVAAYEDGLQDAWTAQNQSIDGTALLDEAIALLSVDEGQVCPTCERRKPHKKKSSSPKSKVFSTRIPLDDVETFNEIVDAAAEHHGLKAKPHHVYWTLLYAVTLLLQQEKGELPV